ncbi:hypothetical protein OGA32_000098 [Salmonella enterica]|nr:hypothetical protein [Salmonella enterica]
MKELPTLEQVENLMALLIEDVEKSNNGEAMKTFYINQIGIFHFHIRCVYGMEQKEASDKFRDSLRG